MGDATPSYNSGNWPLDSLKAVAVASRSWIFYNADPAWPPCKHPNCGVWNSQADLTYNLTPPVYPTNYSTALSQTAKMYGYLGAYWDPSAGSYRHKPILAMYADRTGDPSRDDSQSGAYPYLASHSSPPDTCIEAYRPAGYSPGLSQRGSADWLRGFTCTYQGTSQYFHLADYTAVLQHDYDGLISIETAW